MWRPAELTAGEQEERGGWWSEGARWPELGTGEQGEHGGQQAGCRTARRSWGTRQAKPRRAASRLQRRAVVVARVLGDRAAAGGAAARGGR